MPTQQSFVFDGLSDHLSLPPATEAEAGGERKPTIDERCDADGAKFFFAHQWFIPWIVSYLRGLRRAGAKSGSVRAAFEVARHQFPKELGEEIPGIGKVGLNNNYQHS